MAQRRSEVTVPMLRAMTLAGWTRSPSVPWMVTTSPISAAGNVGDVDHGDVHGDDSDDGGERAAEQDGATIAKRAVDAVAVASREDGDARGALGDERFVVADPGAGGDLANADDARAQAQHRFDREALFDLRAQVYGVVAGMIAIKDGAGADHVGPSFGTGGDGGAIGEMYDARIDAERTETIERGVETLFLLAGLFASARVG